MTDAKQETSDLFPYLQWLDEYVQPRNSISSMLENIDGNDVDDELEDSDGSSFVAE